MTGSKEHKTERDVLGDIKGKHTIVYIDGSGLGDGTAFSWGLVEFTKEEGKVEISGMSKEEELIPFRNVSGELYASSIAIKRAVDRGHERVDLYYDYSGIRHFALGEWKSKNVLTKGYREFYKEYKELIGINFKKVESDSKNVYNDEADRLAKEALGIRVKK